MSAAAINLILEKVSGSDFLRLWIAAFEDPAVVSGGLGHPAVLLKTAAMLCMHTYFQYHC
jgi:hypothetical protein